MDVLLTGATGFVGGHVLSALLSRGHRVRALVREGTSPHHVAHSPDGASLSIFKGSLTDPRALLQAATGCAAAIHLVGIIREKPGSTFRSVHVEGTRHVLDACLATGTKRFIHMSALGTAPAADSQYHQTKYQAEQLVRQSGLDWTIFRPSLIHGRSGEFVQQVSDWAHGRSAPWLFMPYFGRGLLGTGAKALLQPVSVTDVALAFTDALTNKRAIHKTYDLVGTDRVTWPEMYRVLAQAINLPQRRALPIPAWYAELVARCMGALGLASRLPFNLSQVQMARTDNVGDPAPFNADFGWSPAGLRETAGQDA